MKIVQFTSSLLAPLGGAEQYCVELCRWLRDNGHDVTIVTGWVSPEIQDALAAEGLPVTVVRSPRPYPPDRKGSRPAAVLFHLLDLIGTLRASTAVRRALAGADAVHVHRLAGFGAAILRTPNTVMTVHDYGLVDTSTTLLRHGVEVDAPIVQRLRARLVSRVARSAVLIFPSARLREKHVTWGLTLPLRALVIPHGWRVARVTPSHADTVVFLFLGKLIEAKGVRLLLEAWGDGIPGAELWIAGSGELEGEVQSAAVRYLGWVDDSERSAALGAASVVMVPSLWPENFPLVAAEAVLAGLPLISTTVAAPPVLEHERNGLLATPDAASLRAAMESLMEPGVRATFAQGSREIAAELDFDTHGARIVGVYEGMLS